MREKKEKRRERNSHNANQDVLRKCVESMQINKVMSGYSLSRDEGLFNSVTAWSDKSG